MRLKPVPFGGGLAVIAHRDRQEMELDIGVVHPGARADEGGAFKLEKIYTPVKSKETAVLKGDADSVVPQIIDKLKNAAKVL